MTPGTADYPQALRNLGRLSQSPSPMSASLLRTVRNPVPRSVLSGGLASRVGGQQVFPLDLLPAAEVVDALDNGAVPHEPVMCLLHAPLQQRRVKQGEKLRVGILGPVEYCSSSPRVEKSLSDLPRRGLRETERHDGQVGEFAGNPRREQPHVEIERRFV